MKDVTIVVVSTQSIPLLAANHSIAHSPQEAIDSLNDFETIIVAGGGILNASFLEANLIDELYIDVEPILIADGIPLFRNDNANAQRLKLLGSKMISENEVQLHYEVSK